ncbi:hypothetical protein V1477_011505 [Vespula maculifrons]|uniref:Uncharacterized protein n=1 Tax=Vespula maculifrons TaxID=7453 RepID=A0ABD2BZD6_VESMC
MGIVSRTQNDTVSSPRIIEQTWALHRDPVRPPVDRLSALKACRKRAGSLTRPTRIRFSSKSFLRKAGKVGLFLGLV